MPNTGTRSSHSTTELLCTEQRGSYYRFRKFTQCCTAQTGSSSDMETSHSARKQCVTRTYYEQSK